MPKFRATNGTFAAGQPVKRYRMQYQGGQLQLVHRLRAERALGKPLPATAVVHHADGSKSEHAPLVICENESYHRLLHQRMRIVRAGGDPNAERICRGCRQLTAIDDCIPSAAAHNKWQCRHCPALRARYTGWGPEKAAKQRAWRHARPAAGGAA